MLPQPLSTHELNLPIMTLRVLTINLYNGAADPDALRVALESLRPDIVAGQELAENAAEVLQEWGTTALLDPRDDTIGMGVATRFPATMDRLEFPSRNPIRVAFDGGSWGLPEVELISAHLVNPITRPLRRSKQLRRAELAALTEILEQRPDPAVRVVVGDLNSSPAWPLYRRVAELAEDGAVAAGTARRTWSYFPNTPRLLRIDHVFTQGPVRCAGTRLVKIPGDDHRGLFVELEPADQRRDNRHP